MSEPTVQVTVPTPEATYRTKEVYISGTYLSINVDHVHSIAVKDKKLNVVLILTPESKEQLLAISKKASSA